MSLPIPNPNNYCYGCTGYFDSAGFHHDANCPLVTDQLNYTVSMKSNELIIIDLLREMSHELDRIRQELETIRTRMR